MSHSLFIVAAETSGDIYGAGLVRALRERAPDLTLFGYGGPQMAQAGVEVVRDLTVHAAVGVAESLRSFGEFNRARLDGFRLLDSRRPDALVLIDSPELNLRLARAAHERGIPVVYYIAPQVWAWGQWRVKTIRRCVTKLLVILPFEPAFYAQHGVQATFVGHPLVDALRDYRHDRRFAAALGLPEDRPLIGLLPGSRQREISRLLPIFLDAAHILQRNLEDITIAIAPAPTISPEQYGAWPSLSRDELFLVPGKTHELMAGADLLLVASGTATLEAGIIGTPMIVTYKMSPLSWLFARVFARGLRFCSLVNLVADRELVPELLQRACTSGEIAGRGVSFFRDGGLDEMAEALAHEIRPRLGEPGAAGRAADEILALLG
jgi:lipid-A-disaccharide synthase